MVVLCLFTNDLHNDICGLTLFTPHKLQNMPDHDRNRTHDLVSGSPMLCHWSFGLVGSAMGLCFKDCRFNSRRGQAYFSA